MLDFHYLLGPAPAVLAEPAVQVAGAVGAGDLCSGERGAQDDDAGAAQVPQRPGQGHRGGQGEEK